MPENLPFHILTNIISSATTVNPDPSIFLRGGELVQWDSTESIRTTTLVSSGWTDAATFVLYTSVALESGAAAKLFLRTLRERPERANFVRALVLGLGAETKVDSPEAVVESSALLDVLKMCKNVIHLQIKSLHPSMRARVVTEITAHAEALRSLVVNPTANTSQHRLYESEDLFDIITPGLERLEIGFWSAPSTVTPPPPITDFSPLSLTTLRVHSFDAPEVILRLIATAGPTLEHVDCYFESAFDADTTVAALTPSQATLRKLSFMTNPTSEHLDNFQWHETPAFDRLLPHFKHLEELAVSASDLSPNVLHLHTASLRRLSVISHTDVAVFRFDEVLIEDLKNLDLKIGLKEIEVDDDHWSADDAAVLAAACAARGVALKVILE
ncbi:hypothetical protein RQP46_003008 [Phenoliferia psychrophenolica]